MSLPLPDELNGLVNSVVEAEGRNPEYLSIVEMSWDFLQERGYEPESLSDWELDAIYEKVRILCLEVK